MTQAQTLHVIGEESVPDEQLSASSSLTAEIPEPVEPEQRPGLYSDADDVDLSDYNSSYSFPKYVRAVCGRLDGEYDTEQARVVDAMPETTDIEFGLLLAFPDETLLFVGSDPTAKDSIPWFSFAVGPMEPVPTPETAQEALDLLKPPAVRDIVHDEGWVPDRHGEWWLLPTNMVPVGETVKPGVSERPYGASPLGNHVPREFGFTVDADEFVKRFNRQCPRTPSTVTTPTEVIEWYQRQHRKNPTPEWAPTWPDLHAAAGEVLVRGTIRHRDDDHFVERLGDKWHRALTHDMEVYTAGEIATDTHLDYHGR